MTQCSFGKRNNGPPPKVCEIRGWRRIAIHGNDRILREITYGISGSEGLWDDRATVTMREIKTVCLQELEGNAEGHHTRDPSSSTSRERIGNNSHPHGREKRQHPRRVCGMDAVVVEDKTHDEFG